MRNKRHTFESVARRNEARRCAMDMRGLGVYLLPQHVLSYWRSVERQYHLSHYRWLRRNTEAS